MTQPYKSYDRDSYHGKRLRRNTADGLIGGVCAGFGDYFGISHVVMRIIFVIAVLFLGFPLLAYILLWIFIPKDERVIVRRAYRKYPSSDVTSKYQSLETRLQDLERSITSKEWQLNRDFRDLEN